MYHRLVAPLLFLPLEEIATHVLVGSPVVSSEDFVVSHRGCHSQESKRERYEYRGLHRIKRLEFIDSLKK